MQLGMLVSMFVGGSNVLCYLHIGGERSVLFTEHSLSLAGWTDLIFGGVILGTLMQIRVAWNLL